MTSKKERESMDNREKCYKVVQQSSAKGGIKATEIAEKTGLDRTTVHRHLNSLILAGKVEDKQGFYTALNEEQKINLHEETKQPLEKEILIELPMPKNKFYDIAVIEMHAKMMEKCGMPNVAGMERIMIERFNDTRRIRITGKNVDDIDLAKIGNLIEQATAKSSRYSLKGFIKKLPKIP